MKITIDTKEDSKEEIQRVIQLLSGLVGRSGFKGVEAKEVKSGGDLFSSSSRDSGNAFANLFGSGEAVLEASKRSQSKEETPVDLGILSIPREEEKEAEEEIPKIVSY